MSDMNIDIGPIIAQAAEAAVGNLKDFMRQLNEQEAKQARLCIDALSEQMIRLALTKDEAESERIRGTIGHLRNVLANLKGSAQYRAYHVVLATITDVVAAIGAGLLKALI